MRILATLGMAALLASCAPVEGGDAKPATIAVETLSAWDMIGMMADGSATSESLTQAALDRIATIDKSGPAINSVLALMPDALDQARARDAERRAGKRLGPLHGVPVLVKDNIEVAGPVPTTAGSLALKGNITNRDAPLIAKLRAAGAVILGKTNLSEWANIRSDNSTSGWSAVGGLTKNPHSLPHNACGSSSGSGAAVAAGLAPLAVGTETDGSIACPASVNGIVGFKPTVGLVSRRFIVPISHSQDTAGPMTRSVREAAIMLSVMAGSDPGDPATAEADARKENYVGRLSAAGLKGLRIGVVRDKASSTELMDAALKRMEKAGATIVPLTIDPKAFDGLGEAEFLVLLVELKADLNAYLQALPPGLVPHKSLSDIIAFNKANADTELKYFGQDVFEQAEATSNLEDPEYIGTRAFGYDLAGPKGIDRLLAENKIDLIVAQTNGPAWLTTLGQGDKFNPPSASRLPAVAGYPHLTVPMGAVDGLPIGLSFIGPKWADALVLRAGYAFEQAGASLIVTPTYRP